MRTAARFLVPALLVATTVTFVPAAASPPAASVCSSPTEVGTNGADSLRGTPGRDVIDGRGGDDLLEGHGADDVLCGGAGDDVIVGGGGDDLLEGGEGDDSLGGGAGADRATFLDATRAVGVDLAARSASGWGSDDLTGVEDITGRLQGHADR